MGNYLLAHLSPPPMMHCDASENCDISFHDIDTRIDI